MKIQLLVYCKNDAKNLSEQQQKVNEGALILKKLAVTDHLILMDEKGKDFRQLEYSKYLQKKRTLSSCIN